MAAKPQYINVRGNLIDLSVPRVMGIINVTPDSFFSGSRAESEGEIIGKAAKMLEEGADFLDIGGWSSRPGAGEITPEEEMKRVPGAIISVDTYRSEIAERAILEYGAAIINDIAAGEADRLMFQTVARLKVPYIMMHMQGKPETMQVNPVYEDITSEIIRWFGERIARLKAMGVSDIIIDPGFGFGKNIRHNFELLKHLRDFSITGLPLKSIICKSLGITPEEALNGTTVLNTVALLAGADILRVHDVKEAVQAVKLVHSIKNSGN